METKSCLKYFVHDSSTKQKIVTAFEIEHFTQLLARY